MQQLKIDIQISVHSMMTNMIWSNNIHPHNVFLMTTQPERIIPPTKPTKKEVETIEYNQKQVINNPNYTHAQKKLEGCTKN